MRWPWSADHSKSGVSMPAAAVRRAVAALTGEPFVRVRDNDYVALGPLAMEAMVDDYCRSYHEIYRAEFPDCDDFAVWALADVLRGCHRAGWSRAPTFGRALIAGRRRPHLLNIAVHPDGGASLYEPQTGRWLAIEDQHFMEVEL